MKNYFFILLLIFNTGSYCQQVKDKLDSLFSSSFFGETQAAIDVYDLTAKTSVYTKNNKLLLLPASNMKIITSAAGLKYLGSNFSFKTKFCYTGSILNDTLNGDIYVEGGMDPLFSTNDMDSIIKTFKASGIRYINGSLFGDISACDNLFWGSGWMWDDDPSTDAPYLTALNLNSNSISITARGKDPGKPAEIDLYPNTSYVSLKNYSITTEQDTGSELSITRDWINRQNTIIISGNIKKGERVEKRLNIFLPELYFLTVLKERLAAAGINTASGTGLAVIPQLFTEAGTITTGIDTVLVYMNKTSDNLSAEMVVRALALKYSGKPGSAVNGLKMVDSLLAVSGLNPGDYNFADGSGVSRYNLVSAEAIITVLKYVYYSGGDFFSSFYNSLPVAGIDGTLKKRMKSSPSENNVHAKTGTLSGVSCLSGYLTSVSGHMYAFSMMFQNYTRNSAAAIDYQSKICNILINGY